MQLDGWLHEGMCYCPSRLQLRTAAVDLTCRTKIKWHAPARGPTFVCGSASNHTISWPRILSTRRPRSQTIPLCTRDRCLWGPLKPIIFTCKRRPSWLYWAHDFAQPVPIPCPSRSIAGQAPAHTGKLWSAVTRGMSLCLPVPRLRE